MTCENIRPCVMTAQMRFRVLLPAALLRWALAAATVPSVCAACAPALPGGACLGLATGLQAAAVAVPVAAGWALDRRLRRMFRARQE